MKVIVDTCIWSSVLRRNASPSSIVAEELTELIKDGRVQMLGAIRQELLSGIKSQPDFNRLKNRLAAFPDLPIRTRDYETAAEFFNRCRKHGIQGSNTDFLICSVSFHYKMEIFTSDKDFENFKKYLPIRLYQFHKPGL